MTLAAALADRIGAALKFIWGGWAGVAAIALLSALWQVGHEAYGDFILPAPLATFQAAAGILTDPDLLPKVIETSGRALAGFAIAAVVGGSLGLLAGYSPACRRLAGPLLTVVLGVPPIAWIVLAMIWFGSTGATIATSVVIAATPLVFAGVAEGVAGRDRGLEDMARVFGASPLQRLVTVGLRQAAAHLFPALAVALGTAFKVAVMVELLANVGGIGGELARARANLDVALALAWVLVAVAALLVVEFGVVQPVRSVFERWREAGRPWGVRR